MSYLYVPKEEHDQMALTHLLNRIRVNGTALLWCHVPNEGKRNVTTAARLKRQGFRAGIPDVLIFTPPPKMPDRVGTAIELKRAKGGRVTPDQKEWIVGLESNGWSAYVCHGLNEAIEVLRVCGYLDK